ncbi:TPA: protein rep [Klebsiella pneumoniae]|nr:protein rep [Klebsiella pneumoniae]
MLSKERLCAIRAKVNNTVNNNSKKSKTLSSISANGQRITDRKKESFKTANSFIIRGRIEDNETLKKRGERSLNCAQQRYIVSVNGKAHTIFTHRCRSRHCQNCQRIKAFVWQEKMREIFPDLIAKYPTHKYLFITFTVKNPKIKNLRLVLLCMTRAYAKMFQRKAFKKWFVGDIRATEITRGKSGSDEAHPHFHALICVHPSYFQGANYMPADTWGKAWGECLAAEFVKEGLEYNAADYPKGFPRVDIRLAKSADRKTDITNKNIHEHGEQVINYVLKYSVKGSDLLKDGKADAWFWEFDKQVKGIRMIAASGDIKKSLAKLERDQFDYYKEQEKIEKLVSDDDNFKANKAVFKNESGEYDYYLESKKDKFSYIIDAIDAKAYNYQCYYKRMLSDHEGFFREGMDLIASNLASMTRVKDGKFSTAAERFDAIEKAQADLLKIQADRSERLIFICDALVRVGGFKKLAGNVYIDRHTNEVKHIVKANVVDIYKAIESKLIDELHTKLARLSTVETQEHFDALAAKANGHSIVIGLVRHALVGAGAYEYHAGEFIDLETSETLQAVATIE